MKIEKFLFPVSFVNNHFKAASLERKTVMLLGTATFISLVYFLSDRIKQLTAGIFEKKPNPLLSSPSIPDNEPAESLENRNLSTLQLLVIDPSNEMDPPNETKLPEETDSSGERDLPVMHQSALPPTRRQTYNPSTLFKICITYLSKHEIGTSEPNGFAPLPTHIAEQWLQEMQPCSIPLNPLYLRLFSHSHILDLSKFAPAFTDEQLKEISAFSNLKTVIVPPYLFKQFLEILPPEGVTFELVFTDLQNNWEYLNELEDTHFEKLAKNALHYPQIAKVFIFFIGQLYHHSRYCHDQKELDICNALKHKLLNFCQSWIGAGGLKHELMDKVPFEKTSYSALYPYVKYTYKIRKSLRVSFLRVSLVSNVLEKIWELDLPATIYSTDTFTYKRGQGIKDMIESIIQFIVSGEDSTSVLIDLLKIEYQELAPFMYSLLSKYISDELLKEIEKLTEVQADKADLGRTNYNKVWTNIHWIKVFKSSQKLDRPSLLFRLFDQFSNEPESHQMEAADSQVQTSENRKLNIEDIHLFLKSSILDFSHLAPPFTDSQIQEIIAMPQLKKLIIPTAREYICLAEQVLRLVGGKEHIEITLEITDLDFLKYLDITLLEQLANRLIKHPEIAYNFLEIGTIFFNQVIPHWENMQPKHAAAMNVRLHDKSTKNFFIVLDLWIKAGGLSTKFPQLKEKLPLFLAYIISAIRRMGLLENNKKEISEKKWLWVQPIIEPAIQFIVSSLKPIIPLLFLLGASYSSPPSRRSNARLHRVSESDEEEPDEGLPDHSCEEFMHAQFSKYLNADLIKGLKQVQLNPLAGWHPNFFFTFKDPISQANHLHRDMEKVISHLELIQTNGNFDT